VTSATWSTRAAIGAVLLATAALTACSASSGDESAAQAKSVGLMHVGTDHTPGSRDALIGRLEELGWTRADGLSKAWEEGDLQAELRLVRGDDRVDVLWRNLKDEPAADVQAEVFVGTGVDVIVAFEDQSIRAAQKATVDSRTPIVFLHPGDPVRDKLVETLGAPGSNLTGVFSPRDLIGKHLELYTQLVPGLTRVLTLVNPEDPTGLKPLEATRAAAEERGVELVVEEVSTAADIKRVFRELEPSDVDGVILLSNTLRLNFSSLTIRLAKRARLPVQAHRKEWVEAGALFSYGPDLKPIGAVGGRYVDSILGGTDPSELSVEEIPDVEFAINLGTAKRLGIAIPRRMIVLADHVYE
jgi:putative ABC transport system substrate-binding protein